MIVNLLVVLCSLLLYSLSQFIFYFILFFVGPVIDHVLPEHQYMLIYVGGLLYELLVFLLDFVHDQLMLVSEPLFYVFNLFIMSQLIV